MTTLHLTGKILISLATAIYGFIPLFVDLGKTHATNPLWTSHARFHVVWQVIIMFFLAIMGLYFLWFSDATQSYSINLPFLFGLIVLGGFLLNVLVQHLYKGTLSDPNGVPPIFGKVDANLFGFTLGLVLLLLGYIIYHL
jgi:FtsH-binding integral membrane protein